MSKHIITLYVIKQLNASLLPLPCDFQEHCCANTGKM